MTKSFFMVLITLTALNQLKELGRAEADVFPLQPNEGAILEGSDLDKMRKKKSVLLRVKMKAEMQLCENIQAGYTQ